MFKQIERDHLASVDDYIGKCNGCGKEDVEICPDTGWCEDCRREYVEEQEDNSNSVGTEAAIKN